MMTELYPILIALPGGIGVALAVLVAGEQLVRWLKKEAQRIDRIMNYQLMLNVNPNVMVIGLGSSIFCVGLTLGILLTSFVWFLIGITLAIFIPRFVFQYLEEQRLQRLDTQIIDGIVGLASSVRAGMNLVQSFELLIKNSPDPLRQEFQQLMREYELGVDLGLAMRHMADRVGSSYYRLLFASIQAHRDRGGNMGESLDRIADSIREIYRLEGRLNVLTAQGRSQARFLSVVPFVVLLMMWGISPDDTALLFTETTGRLILLVAVGLIVVAYAWIRKIMQVDI